MALVAAGVVEEAEPGSELAHQETEDGTGNERG